MQHEDGRIFGCRALIPYQHTRSYERRAMVKPSREGVASSASGAFTQLLQRYPDIARWIERKIAERSRKHAELTEVQRQLWQLHGGFLAQCRQAGIQAHEYPFTFRRRTQKPLSALWNVTRSTSPARWSSPGFDAVSDELADMKERGAVPPVDWLTKWASYFGKKFRRNAHTE